MTSKKHRYYNTAYINIKIRKCEDEESSFIRKGKASRRRCEAGVSRDIMKITSEQSGQKQRLGQVPVVLDEVPALRDTI